MRKTKSGFTIVELLIVIVVIGVLAAITIVAYNGIQQRSRDNIRKADLAALEKALALHYVDYGIFSKPGEICTDTSFGAFGSCGGNGTSGGWDISSDITDIVNKKYLSKAPVDPINNSTYNYNYEPWNAGQGGYTTAAQAYDLCATLEAGGTYCINKRT